MRGVLTPQVRTHKHLGLVLNGSLTWSGHISSVYTACVRMIGIVRHLDGTIRPPAMKRIYTAAIRPRIAGVCMRSVERRAHSGCPNAYKTHLQKRLIVTPSS